MEINKVMISGRLTRDPELRYTPSGVAVTTLRMAVNTSFYSKEKERREEVCFIDGNYIYALIIDRSRRKLLQTLAKREEGITVAEFRDLVSGNRKICLLLLGVYDAEGIIKRSGDRRMITEKGIAVLEEKDV